MKTKEMRIAQMKAHIDSVCEASPKLADLDGMEVGAAMIDAMRKHIEQLVASVANDDVWVRWIEISDDAQVLRYPQTGVLIEIMLPKIRTSIDYTVALHEFGHVYGRYQSISQNTVVKERWAWRWAKQNALYWTAEMAREEQECLRRIERSASETPAS